MTIVSGMRGREGKAGRSGKRVSADGGGEWSVERASAGNWIRNREVAGG